jgi:GMP synthase-like glutamine amidotransferase
MRDTPYRSRGPYDEHVRCLVVANGSDADPGFVGERLVHHGYALTHAHREHPYEWPKLEGFDLVLLLGSEWSVYWEAVSSSVEAESALIRSARDRGVPVFGICFGAQMVSHALGGSVVRASEAEVGWYDIASHLPDVVSPGPWLQWHYDSFSVPEDFQCLATSPVGPQAIRLERILATQFHPEATEAIVSRWSSGEGAAELERLGIETETLMDATHRHVVASRSASDRLVDWFVNEVAHS